MLIIIDVYSTTLFMHAAEGCELYYMDAIQFHTGIMSRGEIVTTPPFQTTPTHTPTSN